MDDMELNPSGEQPEEVNINKDKPINSQKGEGIDKKKLVLIFSAIVIVLAVLVVSLILILGNKGEDEGEVEDPIKYSEGLAYEVNEDGKTCTIIGIGKCTDIDVYIPKNIDGYKVVSIGNYAFADCNSLASVIISNSVTSIDRFAFYRCFSLTSITIPDSVISIGDYAFSMCISLESIALPDSLAITGEDMFSGCDSMQYNEYDNAKYVGSDTNPYLYLVGSISKEITGCTIHPQTKLIGNGAFGRCESLIHISIPNSVTRIGDGAFYTCTSLESITIPDSVTSIGYSAFGGCTSLASINIPNSITNIEHRTFAECSSLKNIIIPSSVTSIDEYAFSDCRSLTSINIPDSVTNIGEYAFVNCRSLTSINIPDSVTNIGDGAFFSCKALKIYCEAESKPDGWHEDWNSNNNPVVWDIKNSKITILLSIKEKRHGRYGA